MQKRLANKLTMYQSILKLLNANKDAWESVVVLVEIVGNFETLLGEIEHCRQVIDDNKKGMTVQKAVWQQQLIELIYQVASALYVMATRAGDPVLAEKVNYTETDLLKTRDHQLVTLCTGIAELATRHLSNLASFGITDSELEELQLVIQQFSESLPIMRVSVSERKATNEKLKELFVQTDALLKNQLDRLMIRYKQTQPGFYSSYKTSRHVINYGVRHTKGKGEEKIGEMIG